MEKILANALGQDLSKLAAQEKRLLLSRLLGRLAHEIRNPLSSLDIHVQLLEEDLADTAPELKERFASRFEIIRGELHRLENIIKQFVSLTGPTSVNLQTVEIEKIIRHVCELLQPEAATRKVTMQMEIGESVPGFLGDPAQLTQALVNLAINALQAVDEGGRVEMAARLDQLKNAVVLEVRDTGPGVPVERQSAIFEPFFTTKTDGSGLGLWIVQQIAATHGGLARVSNGQHGGAVFALELPVRE